MKDELHIGDRFDAIIRHSEHSSTIGIPELGIEPMNRAGASVGMFIATKVHKDRIEAGDRQFNLNLFRCEKIMKDTK